MDPLPRAELPFAPYRVEPSVCGKYLSIHDSNYRPLCLIPEDPDLVGFARAVVMLPDFCGCAYTLAAAMVDRTVPRDRRFIQGLTIAVRCTDLLSRLHLGRPGIPGNGEPIEKAILLPHNPYGVKINGV